MRLEEFLPRWRLFATRWKDEQQPDLRAKLVDDLLARGLGDVLDSAGVEAPGADRLSADDLFRCEVAVVRRSKALATGAYTRANAEVRAKRLNPVEHFCRTGWRSLRNPSRKFDVWWYWSEYLDPRAETVNPLLHHLVAGKFEGNLPVPPREPVRQPTSYEPGRTPRRVCLFAAYDADGVVDDCVVDYLTELSRHADVYYLADGYIEPEELAKLSGVTRGAWAQAHGAYDFGSYSRLARDLVGWDVIDEYDELLLANDSAYLLRPLDDVFAEMDGRACDWWGLQATRHDFVRDSNGGRPLPLPDAKQQMIGERFMSELDHLHISSYFLVYRRAVVADPGFRRRLDAVVPQAQKVLVIYKYEIGLSRYLMCRGFDFSTFIDDLYPFHPLYTEQYFELLARGFPLLKRNFLSENSRNVPDLVHWRERVLALVPDAAVDRIEADLLRAAPDDRLRRSFAIVTDESGVVVDRRPLTRREVAEEDRYLPRYDHWWAFPVCALTHRLTGAQRAVVEELRDDPSVKKVVLTRGRKLELDGENVTVVPLLSSEGQQALLRAGNVLVPQTPRVGVPYPLASRRRRVVHVGAAARLESPDPLPPPADRWDEGGPGCSRAVASSQLDRLSVAARLHPFAVDDVWVTGLLRNDLVLRPFAALPDDLQEQERRLRELLGTRRLLLVSPSTRSLGPGAGPVLSADDLEVLRSWCARSDAVLGFHDDGTVASHRLAEAMLPAGAMRLSWRSFPDTEVVDRVAAAMLTDHADRAVEFLATGKPVVSRVGPHGSDGRILYDLESVLPGPVCRDTSDLEAAMDAVLDPRTPEQEHDYARKRALFHGRLDDRNARRLVRLVKELYVG